jgi:hypothetical protein
VQIIALHPGACYLCPLNYLLGQHGAVAFFPRTA